MEYVEQDRRADGPVRMVAFRECPGNQERTHADGCGKLEIDRSICRISSHRMPQSSPAAFPTKRTHSPKACPRRGPRARHQVLPHIREGFEAALQEWSLRAQPQRSSIGPT